MIGLDVWLCDFCGVHSYLRSRVGDFFFASPVGLDRDNLGPWTHLLYSTQCNTARSSCECDETRRSGRMKPVDGCCRRASELGAKYSASGEVANSRYRSI